MEKKKNLDPMTETVTVTLPRATGKEENFVFVGFNGRGYNILRGEPVSVPRPVAEILDEAERQQLRQEQFIRRQLESVGQSARNAGLR